MAGMSEDRLLSQVSNNELHTAVETYSRMLLLLRYSIVSEI